jgi:glycosyltransferase involved in cell wall biosynthesis
MKRARNTKTKLGGRLLCLSYRFPPETYPLAIRVKYFLNHLRQNGWTIDAITAAPDAASTEHLTVHHVSSYTPERLFGLLKKLRLTKFLNFLVWPDPFIFWVMPAYWQARRLLERHDYDAIVVFMMPYSPGLAGVLLKKQTGLPLILNLNDSLTCSDMDPSFPSRLHYTLAGKLEDLYVQVADAVVYVSQRNLERVRARQPEAHRDKFHLIRRGAQPPPSPEPSIEPCKDDTFRIVYTGGTSGWYQFLEETNPPSVPKRLYQGWQQLGQHTLTPMDYRTHGPIFVGQAVERVLDHYPDWADRIHVDVYGSKYPDEVVHAVLDRFDLHDIVRLHGRVPHEEALRHMAAADLLFMALPDRTDGTPGGRISAKTYEYLMTDRPILAALPPGENRDYLRDKPGVHLTAPDGVDEMATVIANQATAAFGGDPETVDRSPLRTRLSSTTRAQAFERILYGLVGSPSIASAASAVESASS